MPKPNELACGPRRAPSAARRRSRASATTVVAALVAAALAGCAAMHPAPAPEPRLDVAALGARADAAPWPREDWWRRYGDAQLDALVAEGLAGSPSLAAARARLGRAVAAAGVARSALFPQLGANGSLTYQRYSENYIFPPPFAGNWDSDNRLTLDLTYEFDFWNKNGAALQAALSQAQAVAADAEAARVLLAASIARDYFNLQRLFVQAAISRAAIAQRDDIVRITAQRFGAGLDTRVEVRQAEAALATVRTELAQYDEAIAAARHQLAALVAAAPTRGDAIVAVAAPGAPATPRPAVVPLDLVARRPEIVASRWRVDAAAKEIESAQAMFYPNVNLVAFVGLNSIGLSKLVEAGSGIAGAGPALHLPIFSGGRLNANLRGREAERDLAVDAYNQALIDAVHDVADALSSLHELTHIAAEQARARAATTDAYQLAVVRYRAGLGNYLTVLTAQTQQLAQDRLDADLKARALLLDVNLARALGGGYAESAPLALSAPPLAAGPR